MTREEFEIKAHQFIDELSYKIDELSLKADSFSAEVKAEIQEKIKNLKEEREELKTKMNDFNNDADVSWDEAKADFADALDSIKTGFSKLGKIFD